MLILITHYNSAEVNIYIYKLIQQLFPHEQNKSFSLEWTTQIYDKL